MKRKRGHKKGKSKKLPLAGVNEPSPSTVNVEVEEESDTDVHENDVPETGMDARKTPSSSDLDQPDKSANINPNGVTQKPVAVYGRVKVRLKTSKTLDRQVTSSDAPSKTSDHQVTSSNAPPKTLDCQVTSSDAPTQSDTDRSIQQTSIDKQGMLTEKMEDSANSVPEVALVPPDNISRKSGNIKIKSSKTLASKSSSLDTDNEQQSEKAQRRESFVSQKKNRYNKQELQTALEVIKKIMKMDAAEPFNAPVNPIELGIPDYFDVIDTPMDFSTICANLESGTKYMDSEDVYRDVQHIWENCSKYNNKGDYIVDLMRRVKKNFSKYWCGSGLYTDYTRNKYGGGGDEFAAGSHGKKLKKGKGIKKHKDGCMCAICIMKRRRKERETREAHETRKARTQAAQLEFGISSSSPAADIKEESAHVESSRGEDTSSYMETSADIDADAEIEDTGGNMRLQLQDATGRQNVEHEEENKMDFHGEGDRSTNTLDSAHRGGRSENESYPTRELKTLDDSGGRSKTGSGKQSALQHDNQGTSHQQSKRELLEREKKRQKSKLCEHILSLQHPMLWDLAGTLFPDSSNNVWSGPHSLVRCQKSFHSSDMQSAVDSFMSLGKP